MTSECQHKFIYLESKKHKDDRLFGAPEWRKIDYYFCEKCLKEESKYKYECGWEKPDWY